MTSVIGLVFLPCGSALMVINLHCPLCSLLTPVCPELFPDKVRAAPHVPSSSLFSPEGCAFDVSCFVSEDADLFTMSRHSLSATGWNSDCSLHNLQSESLPDGLVECILQFTRAPAKHFPNFCVFNSRYLATASNSGDSSTSRSQFPSSPTLVQNIQSAIPQLNWIAISSQSPAQLHTALNSLSIIFSAGLGSSLYSLGADPTENTVSNSSFIVA
jgi:hypothetical protein